MAELNSDVTTCERPPCTTGPAGRALIVWFLLVVFGVPVVQVTWEVWKGEAIQELDVFRQMPTLARLQSYERALEKNSVVSQGVQPFVQWMDLVALRSGTRKAVVGREGTIFFRPAVDSAVMGDFMADPEAEGHPLGAIAAFRDTLNALGVELVVLIVPGKQTVYPECLSGRYEGVDIAPTNAGMTQFLAELRRQGVRVVDPTAAMRAAKARATMYLRQDTHWTPQGLEVAAGLLMDELHGDLRGATRVDARQFEAAPVEASNHGDLYDMLNLPGLPTPLRVETVTIRRVVDVETGEPVEPNPSSPVVLLGDSFTNIYSLPEMKWGDHAGLGEQLALRLGAAVDVIAHNDGGVNTARAALARRRDGMQGKKAVIWQFAARDLVVSNGEWKRIDIAAPKGE